MFRSFGMMLAVLLCGSVFPAWGDVQPPAQAQTKDKPDFGAEFYGFTNVWKFHIQIPAKDFADLEPKGGRRFPRAPAQPEPPADNAADKPTDVHKGSGFGMEFPWVHCNLTAKGQTHTNLGIRYKGNASYMASSRGLKRNFKVDVDLFDNDLRFHGLKKLNLNAGAMDPTRMREALSFAVFRAAGVPAPRTAYAEVTLTVPGKYDQEYVGLYTLVEQVDTSFLKRHFKNGKGVLLKPERVRGIEYMGDDWDHYKERYQPRDEPTVTQARRVIAFARLVNLADDEQFAKEIDAYLDVDNFLRYLAVNALIVNLDSFLSLGHNYYIYLNPETDKFAFIPWDMDLSFANFPMGGSAEQQFDLSIQHPHAGTNKLIDRLLAIPDVNAKYRGILQELTTTCFAREQLSKDLDTLERVVKEPLAREKKAVAARKEDGPPAGPGMTGRGPGMMGPGPGMMGRGPALRAFVAKRTDSVTAQLAGKRKGVAPPAFGGFGLGNRLAKPLLEALDPDKSGKLTNEQLVAGVKQFFSEADKANKGTLDEAALTEILNRLTPRPPGSGPPGGPRGDANAPPAGPPGRAPGGPPGPGGLPGGPMMFDPGKQLASGVIRRADTNNDKQVTLDELLTAAESVFQESDKEKKGVLDEQGVAEAINRLMPPMPGFGPPGSNAPGATIPGAGPRGIGPSGGRPGEQKP